MKDKIESMIDQCDVMLNGLLKLMDEAESDDERFLFTKSLNSLRSFREALRKL